MFNDFDVVELTHDIVENKLKEGESGTIVDIYRNGKAYEVEFISPDGSTSILLTLMPSDIRSTLSKREHSSYVFNPSIIYAHNAKTFTRGFDPVSGVDLVVKTKDEKKIKEFNYSFEAV